MQSVLAGVRQAAQGAVNDLLAKLRESAQKTEAELTSSLDKGRVQVEAGVSKGLAKNDDVLTGLDAKMTKAAEKAAEEYDRPWWKKALFALGKALAYLVVGIVAAVVLAGLLVVLTGIAFATAFVAVMVVMAVAFVAFEFYTRLQAYKAEHGPVGSWWKALGISAALLGISIASITGVPQMIEGVRGKRFFSDRKLSEQERYDLAIGGFLQLLLLAFGGKLFRGRKPGIEPGQGGEPVRTLPPGETGGVEPGRPATEPGGTGEPARTEEPGRTEEPPEAQQPGGAAQPAPGAYDATTRTADQLALDRDATPRVGETVEQAQARSQAAAAEIALREAVRIYDALGDRPPRVDVRANDAANPGPAHTIERHGPEIPLEQGDAPAGSRTVEGRIYGDPPWAEPANFSYKWMDEATMNEVVNNYLRNNWETVRSDLAMNARHEATFNNGQLAGEGFYNSNYGTPNPPNAVYSQTSIVTITLELIPGSNPPAFRIVRTFPNGRGFQDPTGRGFQE
jgi:hypothetical protein